MNACNQILGIPRVAPRVASTRSGVRNRVMATSYTEIVEILEVKNVYTYTIPSFSAITVRLRHVNVSRLTYLKNQRFFDKLRAVPEGFGL